MIEEIRPLGIYTTNEVKNVLRISESTLKRLLKKGLIRANKVGGQYRILGKEILKLVSPELEEDVEKNYMKMKDKVINKISNW
jgi:excisionase family DNA binding protein